MNQVLHRNSGATLTPCVMKTGANAIEQGVKMSMHPTIFAPVLHHARDGYLMPMLREVNTSDQIGVALRLLTQFWYRGATGARTTIREQHHYKQVQPLAGESMRYALATWFGRLAGDADFCTTVTNVHGDPTAENIMLHDSRVVWIDPSTRPMPHEAEFDVAKVLQSYYGYTSCSPSAQGVIIDWLRTLPSGLNYTLVFYYLLTHLVRLHAVQPQARAWAVQLALRLDKCKEELLCAL